VGAQLGGLQLGGFQQKVSAFTQAAQEIQQFAQTFEGFRELMTQLAEANARLELEQRRQRWVTQQLFGRANPPTTLEGFIALEETLRAEFDSNQLSDSP